MSIYANVCVYMISWVESVESSGHPLLENLFFAPAASKKHQCHKNRIYYCVNVYIHIYMFMCVIYMCVCA